MDLFESANGFSEIAIAKSLHGFARTERLPRLSGGLLAGRVDEAILVCNRGGRVLDCHFRWRRKNS
jgi:hypothetical protein